MKSFQIPKPMYLFLVVGIIMAFTIKGPEKNLTEYTFPTVRAEQVAQWIIEESAQHMFLSASHEGELANSFISQVVDASKKLDVSLLVRGKTPLVFAEQSDEAKNLAKALFEKGFHPMIVEGGWPSWRTNVLQIDQKSQTELSEEEWQKRQQLVSISKFLRGEMGVTSAPAPTERKKVIIRRVR
ncbi:MAG: hypothetical protein KDD61_00005, partial [Bdellovibrionales bacterium]|nr:hypothetical protein [Bdellovibrionales bacterium]